ncbi:MAG: hypothetical protein VX498_12560 [Myxococcota bacterium]|nr:hypothetical protein [Myxococcota bacterium]
MHGRETPLLLPALFGALCLGLTACGEPAAPAAPADLPVPSPPQAQSSEQSENRGPPRYQGLSIDDAGLSAIQTACSRTPTSPEGAAYAGPVVDAHVHTALENNQRDFALALLQEMNQSGVSRVLVQPDHSPDLTLHPGLLQVYREVESTWGRIASVCDRILPLVYAFDPADPGAWDYVQQRLETGHYAGVGEIEFLHTRMGIRKPVHSETMDRIYRALQERVMVFHFQADTARDPALGTEIGKLINSYPGISFVWFGSDQCFDHPEASNLLCTVFPNRQLVIFDGLEPWQTQRAVMGTDASPAGFHSASQGHLPYSTLGEGVSVIREMLGKFDQQKAGGIGHRHFDRLLD